MDQHLAVTADQEGIAHALEVQRIDDLHQCLQPQITTHHTDGLTGALCRCGNGNDQLSGSRIDIGFGQGCTAGGHCVLVPGPNARVVVGRHLVFRTHGETAALLAQIGEVEGRGQCPLLQQIDYTGVRIVVGNRLCGAFDQQNAAGQPVLNVVRSHLAHLVQITLEVLANGAALQVIVVQREQGERRDHDE